MALSAEELRQKQLEEQRQKQLLQSYDQARANRAADYQQQADIPNGYAGRDLSLNSGAGTSGGGFNIYGASDLTQEGLKQYGQRYQESQTVTQARDYLQQLLNNKPGAYAGGSGGQGNYGAQIANLYNQVVGSPEFKYDVNKDPLFQSYKNNYMQTGQRAMQDAVGTAAGLTGDYGNSWGATAGFQAYQWYLQQLNNAIPELEQRAFDKYKYYQDAQRADAQLAMAQDQMAYNRYRDTVQDWMASLDFANTLYGQENTWDRNDWNDLRDYYTTIASMENADYWRDRDFGENARRYDLEFYENQRLNDRDFSENARRYDMDFYETQRLNNIANDQNQRDFEEYMRRYDLEFGENNRRYDLEFGENQRLNDRDFLETQRLNNILNDQNQRDFEEYQRRYNLEYGQNQRDFEETQRLNNILNEQNQRDFEEYQRRYNLEYGQNQRDFEETQRLNDRNFVETQRLNNAELARDQRDFDETQRLNDRTFAETQRLNDRNFVETQRLNNAELARDQRDFDETQRLNDIRNSQIDREFFENQRINNRDFAESQRLNDRDYEFALMQYMDALAAAGLTGGSGGGNGGSNTQTAPESVPQNAGQTAGQELPSMQELMVNYAREKSGTEQKNPLTEALKKDLENQKGDMVTLPITPVTANGTLNQGPLAQRTQAMPREQAEELISAMDDLNKQLSKKAKTSTNSTAKTSLATSAKKTTTNPLDDWLSGTRKK